MNTGLILTLAVASVGLYFLSRLLFNRDTAVEQRRRNAIGLSQWCSNNGLPLISKALNCYAVGDYSGLLYAVGDLRETVADPDQANPALDKFLKTQLIKKLNTEDGREELLLFVERHFNIEIPREIVKGLNKRRLLTEYEAADEVDAAVSQVVSNPPSQG